MTAMQVDRRSTIRAALLAGLVSLASGCGGGGGSAANIMPTAAFAATPISGLATPAVQFDGSASTDPDGTVVSWQWTFGDGSTGSGSVIQHSYATAGTYTATLTVTDNQGGTASSTVVVSATVNATPNTPPTALFSANPGGGIAALPVNFDASAATDPDGTIVSWQWAFGDGSTGSGSVIQHSYATAGTYTATLTVTDDRGGTAVATVNIIVAANTPPLAVLNANTVAGFAPLTVQFDGSASTDADGTIVSWQWAFGDGSTGSGSTLQHIYATAGTYTATLTVTDDHGGTAVATTNITATLNTPPLAVLNANTVEGFAPLTVQFNGNASTDADGPIAGYLWNFGNGDSAAIAAATALYSSAGQYTAQLTVTDGGGVTASATTTVYVATTADSFTLAGALSVPDTLFADCDTAGGGIPGCNQSVANAQPLPAPAIVGGYAALASDASDYFSVALAGGETISLFVADSSPTNNIDLKLYDASGTTLVVQSANTNTARESLGVPAAGNYIVQVESVAGSSNYVLSIGTATASTAGEFVDGEFIAHFTQLRVPWRIDAQREARSAELDLEVIGGNADTPMLLRDRTRPRTLQRSLDKHAQATLARLRTHPDVAWVEPNRVRNSLGINATDTYYPLQWNLPLAHFPGAWEIDALHGSGAVVAVIDTGILATHPDLAGRITTGYDFISDPANANDGDGIDTDPADPGGDGIGRSTFHGSHVAGIIAANAQFVASAGNTGIAGAAPGAQVMPLRVIGRYGGTSYDIVQAIRYAAGLSNDSNTLPAAPADVINLSIGATGYSQAEQDAVTAARAAGVIVVAAGGNTGTNISIYPAAYVGATGVGAVTLDQRRAAYSTLGAHIDIAAPGGDNSADLDGNGFPDGILGTLADDSSGVLIAGYDFYQGTSMAAPHVAAVAALMKALSPTLTPAAFDSLLAAGDLTRDLGAGGRDDEYGMGLLDAEKALVATGLVSATPAAPVASPARVSLGATATQALVVVDNGGGGAMQVTSLSDDQPWLTVSTANIDPLTGLGSYLISVDRNTLANGIYTGTITFTTTAGALTVPVTLVVDASIPAATAGTLYVIVWDPVAQQTVTGSAGLAGSSTSFDLGSVIAGNYQVYAGTDNDNDGFICDPGEACGAWLTLDEPKLFPHVRNRTDLSFSIGYSTTLSTLSVNTQTAATTLPARGLPHK